MTHFGTLADGNEVQAITIKGHGLSATVLTYGAILQDVRLDGVEYSLTVASDSLADYETSIIYHGAIVGPVANRITGARAVIDGIEHMLDPNHERRHTLHGGRRGLHNRIWQIADHGDTYIELTAQLMDGEAGFPANRTITARFETSEHATLTLTITTKTDATTLVNMTNHSYWCLNGRRPMADHDLQIFADQYLPADPAGFPTGDVTECAGTPFDFTTPTPLHFGQTGFDHTFCLTDQRGSLTPCLVLRSGDISMHVATTETGIHIYDGRPNYAGLAIEAQSWPDAPHNPHFPSIVAQADTPVVQVTQWKFTQR